MATTVISNACIAGAVAGLSQGRFSGSFTPTDYAGIANAANAIATEFITENTASGAAMADTDNAEIGFLVFGAALAVTANSGATSSSAADYLAIAKQIYATAKQGLTKLA